MDFYAVFAIETMPYVLPFWVKLIEYYVCVGFVAGCKGDDFIVLCHSFEETDSVGSDSDVGVSCGSVLDLDRKGKIIGLGGIFLTVKNGLININEQSFFVVIILVARQDHLFLFKICKCG
jgi:hypothetical protein